MLRRFPAKRPVHAHERNQPGLVARRAASGSLYANCWYLPNGFGPFRSTDAGATVQYMTRGIGEVVTWKPAFHPNDPLRIYLPVADHIGFVVTDGGATGAAQRNPRRSLPVSFGNVGMTYATKALVGPVVGNAAPKVYFTGGSSFGPNDGRASVLTTADDGQTWRSSGASPKEFFRLEIQLAP